MGFGSIVNPSPDMSTNFDARLAVVRSSGLFSDQVLADFARHLKEAPEEELFRASPLRYAPAHGLTEQQAIDLFLHATRAGLLEFSWGLLCPACNGFLNTEAALRALSATKHCTLCDVDVAVSDDNVEVAFTVSPSTRKIRFHEPNNLEFSADTLRLYFSPSVPISPEFAASMAARVRDVQVIPGSGYAVLKGVVDEGAFGVVAPMQHAWARLIVDPAGSSEVQIEIAEGIAAPLTSLVKPGPVTVRVHNCLPRPIQTGFMKLPNEHLRVELQPYLTGKRMVSTQSFRDLFRAESIPASGGLALKSLTVLFTDLKSSTELYERIGDIRAYELVNQHFQVLQKIIAERGGAMVKTIGDAIMASFPDPEPALDAAIAMNKDIQKVGKGELQLKIGIHSGPCIAVELNERLDYFGQTVNIAARVQGVADANEICVTDSVLKSGVSEALIKDAKLNVATQRQLLKGVEGQVTVHHLR